MADERVEISHSSIKRAWKTAGSDDFWLKLRTKHADALALVEAAAADADEAMDPDETGMELGMMTVGPSPGGVVIEIGPAAERDPINVWVHKFAEALQHRGVTGRLGGAISTLGPRILSAGQPPTPTLFTRFGLPSARGDGNPGPWAVDVAQTHQAVRTILDWAFMEPGKVILAQGAFSVEVDETELQTPIERGLRHSGSGGVDVFDEAAQRARHAHLGHVADGLFQSIGGPPLSAVAELRDLATRLPPPLDLAFIRIAHRGSAGINAVDTIQPLPNMREMHVRYVGHLLHRYLPDAHGIQIVTNEHLQAANDLSDWTITDLGHDRHLVVASDLAAWYSETLPDPGTLERARSDWGDAILTQDVYYAEMAQRTGGRLVNRSHPD